MSSSSQMTTTLAPAPAMAKAPPSKRLLFDRRYGFVFDEWQSPSEVALAGGRGMFCIIPVGKALFDRASESINSTANCIINALKNPDELSPQKLQATLTDGLHKFASPVKPESKLFGFSEILPVHPKHYPSHPLTECTESKTDL